MSHSKDKKMIDALRFLQMIYGRSMDPPWCPRRGVTWCLSRPNTISISQYPKKGTFLEKICALSGAVGERSSQEGIENPRESLHKVLRGSSCTSVPAQDPDGPGSLQAWMAGHWFSTQWQPQKDAITSHLVQGNRTNSIRMYIHRMIYILRNWITWLWELICPKSAVWASRPKTQ